MSTPGSLGKDEAGALLGVSRETLERLAIHIDLLQRWQARINLVGRSTLEDPWRRHVLDSGQLFRLCPTPCHVGVDLGSGAGFPGLVLAIMGIPEMHLIESDQKKAAFLREAARLTRTTIHVHAQRIEAASPITADLVTARALAPLANLIDLAARFVGSSGICIFPKGRDVEKELTDSIRSRMIDSEHVPSQSDPSGVILRFRIKP